MKNIVIVEDNLMMQDHLRALLEKDGRYRVAGTYRDAFEAEAACKSGRVDFVLMDVQTLHNHSGLAAGERIRKSGAGARVLVVTSLIDPEILARARAGAADSLWYKDHGGEDLLAVLERTLNGERVFPDAAPSVDLKEMFSHEITPRQLSILRRFVQGMTYEEIAGELGITKDGVRWNLNQILEKGGFQNKYELLIALVENKLVVTSLLDEKTE